VNGHQQREKAPSMLRFLKNRPSLYSGTVFIEYTRLYRSKYHLNESMKILLTPPLHKTVIQSAKYFLKFKDFLMISVLEVTLASQRGFARRATFRLFFAQD
jgi:hypothetical protein